MANLGTRLLEMSFGRPSGPLGRIGGRLMARGNAATERRLVDLAELDHRDVVLVLGPGPGIGLEAAARRARLGATRPWCRHRVPAAGTATTSSQPSSIAGPGCATLWLVISSWRRE